MRAMTITENRYQNIRNQAKMLEMKIKGSRKMSITEESIGSSEVKLFQPSSVVHQSVKSRREIGCMNFGSMVFTSFHVVVRLTLFLSTLESDIRLMMS